MKMKGITDVPAGATQVKSARGGRVCSAPKMETSSYLEIFTTNLERVRLRQEQSNLAKRRISIDDKMTRNEMRLREIQARMHSLAQRTVKKESDKVAPEPRNAKPPLKKWQTVAADY